ncbi:MAG: ABC transporter substrate-binding protein [Clostridia bacterium]|nr:ABC transporter substrate-binding protein [Clostridia bacterium]
MKKIIAIVLAALMLATALVLASCEPADSKPTLNVYTNAGFAPYEYLDSNGNVVGVDMDVITYIGEQLGYKVVINDIEFNQILNEVANDKFAVGAAGMTKKPARDEVALASDIYATSIQYVIAPKGTFEAGAVVPAADVVSYILGQSAKAIGVQKGTTGADLAAGAVEGTDASTMEYSNAIVASADIGTTVSAVIIDKMPAESICSNNANLECWQLDADVESYVMYFNKEATELVAQVNEILGQMIADGKIDEYTVNHSSGN